MNAKGEKSEKSEKMRSPRPARIFPIGDSRLTPVIVAADGYLGMIARREQNEVGLAEQERYVFKTLMEALYGSGVFDWIEEELS